jgi:hypothetical protein
LDRPGPPSNLLQRLVFGDWHAPSVFVFPPTATQAGHHRRHRGIVVDSVHG